MTSELQIAAPAALVYSFNSGVEVESAGRSLTKQQRTLRQDLAALPHVLALDSDIVCAPSQTPEFLISLQKAGFSLPEFREDGLGDKSVIGHRPFGVPGDHLRRSNVAKLHDHVAVCRSMEEVQAAVLRLGRVVLKAEFSSGGQGLRWRWNRAGSKEWAQTQLTNDSVVTVEPWVDILAEFSGLFWEGEWAGLSLPIVEGGVWRGHWLGEPLAGLSEEVHNFVFEGNRVECTLRELRDLPATCGIDVAVIRTTSGGLELRILELNARTTMGHYALAVKKRMPSAQRFRIVRLTELAGLDAVLLTNPETATSWCAVAERSCSVAPLFLMKPADMFGGLEI